jgi:hypothetical protein
MATVQLRLRGLTVPQLFASVVSAAPAVILSVGVVFRHARPTLPLMLMTFGVALLPWLSLLAARATYRAKCDDIAVHVRGEALPYKTIKEVRLQRTPRRMVLRLIRSEDVWIELVLWDRFAGRLQPLDELAHRLEKHGHPIPKD